MKGLGTNDTALINELTSLTRSQMIAVRVAFNKQFGRDLVADVKSETRANYQKAMVGLLLSPAEFDCMALNDATKGIGSNKHAITRIICTRSPAEMDAIQASYYTMYGRSLVDHIWACAVSTTSVGNIPGSWLGRLCLPVLTAWEALDITSFRRTPCPAPRST